MSGDRPPGMLWSDVIGWYFPVCVPKIVWDQNSTSGERIEMVPISIKEKL